MTTRMLLHAVTLVGHETEAAYEFKAGINVIHGETGSGKSSLFEALKYSMGGKGTLSPAVREGVQRIRSRVRIGNSEYQFARRVGATTVEVAEADGSLIDVMAVNRRKEMPRVSDFLRSAAGLPEVRLSSSRSARTDPVSFWDFYGYVYIPQSEIDRSVIGHLDTFRNRKRKAVFELLFGLTTEEVARLRQEVDELNDELRDANRELRLIDEFLDGLDLAAGTELAARRHELEAELLEQERMLDLLRTEGHRATTAVSEQQSRLRGLLERAGEAARIAAELEARIAARMEFRFELESDRERIVREGSATDLLGTLDFHQCPRCLQEVVPERTDADHCYLCGQSEPRLAEGDDNGEGEAERQRRLNQIDELLVEIHELIASDRDELDAATSRRRSLEAVSRELGADLDQASSEYVSPRFDEIAHLGARIGELRQERSSLDLQQRVWQRQAGLRERLGDLEGQLSDAKRRLERATSQLDDARVKVDDLSGVFDEIVQSMNMPWYSEPARIDPETYLPIVNGVGLEELSSGGMKMMTNVAYHLAMLTYALAHRDTHVPSMLIVDSPRKNLGSTQEDQYHSDMFYRWVDGLVSAYRQEFQIVIADNDPPSKACSWLRRSGSAIAIRRCQGSCIRALASRSSSRPPRDVMPTGRGECRMSAENSETRWFGVGRRGIPAPRFRRSAACSGAGWAGVG